MWPPVPTILRASTSYLALSSCQTLVFNPVSNSQFFASKATRHTVNGTLIVRSNCHEQPTRETYPAKIGAQHQTLLRVTVASQWLRARKRCLVMGSASKKHNACYPVAAKEPVQSQGPSPNLPSIVPRSDTPGKYFFCNVTIKADPKAVTVRCGGTIAAEPRPATGRKAGRRAGISPSGHDCHHKRWPDAPPNGRHQASP